jgi:hypothetical protein
MICAAEARALAAFLVYAAVHTRLVDSQTRVPFEPSNGQYADAFVESEPLAQCCIVMKHPRSVLCACLVVRGLRSLDADGDY